MQTHKVVYKLFILIETNCHLGATRRIMASTGPSQTNKYKYTPLHRSETSKTI